MRKSTKNKIVGDNNSGKNKNSEEDYGMEFHKNEIQRKSQK
jgi:hypothetical protein